MPELDPNRGVLEPPDQDLASDRAEALLAECLSHPASERGRALDAACSRHPDLAAELRTRVAALRAMGIELGESRGFPEQLGDYRLIERLGSGGMGVVYLAVQTSLQRDVALKLIRPEHMYFAGARARFRREAEAVARLEHPGIVPIYAVGEEAGIPYFAMELFRGSTLAEALHALRDRAPESLRGADLHAVAARAARSDHPLSEGSLFDGTWIQACLRIGRAIAEALQHAHEHGLVHRDVKPSNVALSHDGRVRLFDFGLTSAEGAADVTRSGSQLGTLHYMSPEQLRGARDADARSDVYSLGVTLYEMLALQLPYRGDDALEVQRLVNDGRPDPLRPRNRRVDADVETVVLCALDRDPSRRYASAADLARDLGHLLAHRPIEARRPGVLLRARRWMQRHPIAATAFVVVPALALASGSTILARERAHSRVLAATLDEVQFARDEAEDQAEASERAFDFVVGMFTPEPSEIPVTPDTPSTDIRDVFLHGEARVVEQLAGDARSQARMYMLIGYLHARRDSNPRAIELYEKALAIWRREDRPADRPHLAETLASLGEVYHQVGRGLEGNACLRESLSSWPEGEAGDRGRQRVMQKLLTLGRIDERESTEAVARAALERELAGSDPNPREVAIRRLALASTLLRRNASDEAEPEMELARDVLSHGGGAPGDRVRAEMLNLFAILREHQGRTAEAIELARGAVAAQRGFVPRNDQKLGIMLHNLAAFEETAKDYSAALEHGREAVALFDATLTPDHPATLGAVARLAIHAAHAGECAEADEAACSVLAARAKLDPGDPAAARATYAMALCAGERGDVEAAVTLWRSTARTLQACPGFQLEAAAPLYELGRLHLANGAIDEAGAVLAEAYACYAQRTKGVPPQLFADLARACRAAGREFEAISYESRLEE